MCPSYAPPGFPPTHSQHLDSSDPLGASLHAASLCLIQYHSFPHRSLTKGDRMKLLGILILISLSSPAMAQTLRFGEPKGTAMWSMENHKPSPDGYSGVKPVVTLGNKEMKVVWGDSRKGDGEDITWRAKIVSRTARSVSAIATEVSDSGSAVMLFSIDLKRGFLYLTIHKETSVMNGSAVNSFVAKLEP